MKTSLLCIVALITIAAAMLSSVSAHIPVLVLDDENYSVSPVIVKEPEISYAYYGQMNGQPHLYLIKFDKPGELYVNLLAPYDNKSNATPTIGFTLYNESGIIVEFSNITNWTIFYEEYGGDWYLRGPEFDMNVSEGDYFVKISSQTNTDLYVVAIGKIEKFGIPEILNTICVLPLMKAIFYGDYTLMLICMLIPVLILAVIVFLIWKKRTG